MILFLLDPEFQNQVATRFLFMIGLSAASDRFRNAIAEVETLIDARLATLHR